MGLMLVGMVTVVLVLASLPVTANLEQSLDAQGGPDVLEKSRVWQEQPVPAESTVLWQPVEADPDRSQIHALVTEPEVERDRDGQSLSVREPQTGRAAAVCSSPEHQVDLECPFDRDGSAAGSWAHGDASVAGGGAAFARASVAAVDDWAGFAVWGAGFGLLAFLSLILFRVGGVWAVLRMVLPAGWRLDREQVHAHPTRRAILGHLEKHPGATAQELAETAGVRNRRAVYHLSILQREDCVSVRKVEGRKHYFARMAPKADCERLRLRAFARASRPGGQMLVLLARDPGATVSQVARRMGFAPGHAHYHLTKLAKEGLVDRLRRGRRVRHYLTTLGHELVADELRVQPGVSPGLAGSTKASDPAAASV